MLPRPIVRVLAATFVFIGAACGGGGEPAPDNDAGASGAVEVRERPELPLIVETVASSDDLASVGLPEGALPDGLTAADISVTPITAESFFGTDANEGSFRAYRLEPAGTQFKRPVIFSATVPLELDDGTFTTPLVLLRSSENEEIQITVADDVRVELDQDAGTMTVLATIEHFSEVLVDRSGLFVTHIKPPASTYKVGQSFTFVLTVTTQERRFTWDAAWSGEEYLKDVIVSVGVGTTFEVNGGLEAHRGRGQDEHRVITFPTDAVSSPVLTPNDVPLPSDSPRAEIGYRFAQDYTCSRAGEDTVLIVGGINIYYTHQTESTAQEEPNKPPTISRKITWTSANIETPDYTCVDPPTPTPPPASTAAPTATPGNITCVTFLGQTTCTDEEGNPVPLPPTPSPTPAR